MFGNKVFLFLMIKKTYLLDIDPIWNVSSIQTVFLASKSRTENEEQAEWMRNTLPNAQIMHLSC